jgi:hypothetical protein
MTHGKRIQQNFFQLNVDQSPQSFLDEKSEQYQLTLNDAQFALAMDNKDPLGCVRQEFFYPRIRTLPNGLYKLLINNLIKKKQYLFISS